MVDGVTRRPGGIGRGRRHRFTGLRGTSARVHPILRATGFVGIFRLRPCVPSGDRAELPCGAARDRDVPLVLPQRPHLPRSELQRPPWAAEGEVRGIHAPRAAGACVVDTPTGRDRAMKEGPGVTIAGGAEVVDAHSRVASRMQLAREQPARVRPGAHVDAKSAQLRRNRVKPVPAHESPSVRGCGVGR